jgi:hypothetical protein
LTVLQWSGGRWFFRDPRHTRTTGEETKTRIFSKSELSPNVPWDLSPEEPALQTDGRDVHVILQCRTPRDTNPKGHWRQIVFFENPCFLFSLVVLVCLGSIKVRLEKGFLQDASWLQDSCIHPALHAQRTISLARAGPWRIVTNLLLPSRDRKTGYTKTGYMEDTKTRIFSKNNLAPNGP